MNYPPPPGSPAQPMREPDLPPPTTSGAAIASLVISLVGLCVPFIGPLVAIIVGFIGKANVGASRGRLTGGGIALAGILIGVLGIGFHIAAVAGSFWLGSKVMQIAKETEKQIAAINTAAQTGDWDAAAKELTAPGSMSREQVVAKFKQAESKYGTLSNFNIAQADPDEKETERDPLSFPIRLVFNADGAKGPCRFSGVLKRMSGKYALVSLDVEDGHAVRTLDTHRRSKRWDD